MSLVAVSERQSLRQAVVQQQAVGQVGQAIVLSQIGHSQGRFANRAHVVKDHDGTGDLSMTVVYGCRRVFDRQFVSVTADQRAIWRQTHRFVFSNGECHGVARWLARSAVDDSEYFLEWMACSLLLRPAGQSFGNDIEIGYAACHVSAYDRIANRIEGDLCALFLLEQRACVGTTLDHTGDRHGPQIGVQALL